MFGTKAVKGTARFLPAFVVGEGATDRLFLKNLPPGVLNRSREGLTVMRVNVYLEEVRLLAGFARVLVLAIPEKQSNP